MKVLNNLNDRKKIWVLIVLRVIILIDIVYSLYGLYVFIGLIRVDVMKRSGISRIFIGFSKVNFYLLESYVNLIVFFNGMFIIYLKYFLYYIYVLYV